MTVKKGAVDAPATTAAKVRTRIRRDVKAGTFDPALFEDYERIMAAKKKKGRKTA